MWDQLKTKYMSMTSMIMKEHVPQCDCSQCGWFIGFGLGEALRHRGIMCIRVRLQSEYISCFFFSKQIRNEGSVETACCMLHAKVIKFQSDSEQNVCASVIILSFSFWIGQKAHTCRRLQNLAGIHGAGQLVLTLSDSLHCRCEEFSLTIPL